MTSSENRKRAARIVASWPEWKRKVTLTKYSQCNNEVKRER